eukprot:3076928-Rhodomonas_salina.1
MLEERPAAKHPAVPAQERGIMVMKFQQDILQSAKPQACMCLHLLPPSESTMKLHTSTKHWPGWRVAKWLQYDMRFTLEGSSQKLLLCQLQHFQQQREGDINELLVGQCQVRE